MIEPNQAGQPAGCKTRSTTPGGLVRREPLVRDAADRDYRIFVLADCCGDEPAVHDALITHVFPRRADIINVPALAALQPGEATP